MYYWEPEYHILFLTDDSKRKIASSPLICPHPHPQSTHDPPTREQLCLSDMQLPALMVP